MPPVRRESTKWHSTFSGVVRLLQAPVSIVVVAVAAAAVMEDGVALSVAASRPVVAADKSLSAAVLPYLAQPDI